MALQIPQSLSLTVIPTRNQSVFIPITVSSIRIMNSRKRQSDTTLVVPNSSGNSNSSTNNNKSMIDSSTSATDSLDLRIISKPRLKVRIQRFHSVAKWTWNAGSEDEVCGICQSPYEGVAPGVKYPGDECPVVYGKCGHAYVIYMTLLLLLLLFCAIVFPFFGMTM